MGPALFASSLLLFAGALAAQGVAAEPRQVRGRVLDVDGKPLAGAGVAVGMEHELTTADVLARPQVRTGADGTFALALPAEEPAPMRPQAVWIAATGKVGMRVPTLRWLETVAATDGPVCELGDVRLPDGSTLVGRVRGPDGKPLAGARVLALDGLIANAAYAACHACEAVAGADGTFKLPGVFAVAMSVRFRAPGHHDLFVPWLDVGQPLDVQLAPGGFVEGVVLDENGAPADADLTLMTEFLDVPRTTASTVGGRFRIGVPAACRFQVWAVARGQSRVLRTAILDGPTAGLELRFGAEPALPFAVRAVDRDGVAIAAFRAAAWWHDSEHPDGIEDMLRWQLQPAGRDGKVWLPPTYRGGKLGTVLVVAPGRAPLFAKQIVWRGGGEYVAKLEPESRITGRVVDAPSGKPIAGALVACEPVRREQVFGMPQRATPVVSGADGTFAFGGLGPRSYQVSATWANGDASVTQRVKVARDDTENVELVLPAGATVTVKTTGPPLPPGSRLLLLTEAEVTARDQQWFPRSVALDAANAAGSVPVVDGVARLEHRAPGEQLLFLVVPSPPRHGPALHVPLPPVTVGAADHTVEVDVGGRLPGAVAGKLTVAGADLPRSRFAVVATRAAGEDGHGHGPAAEQRRHQWSLVGPDGSFTVPVAPGNVRLQVVDVATGVVFARVDEPVGVGSGKTVTRDLRVDVAAIDVTLDTEGRDRLGADRLEIQAGDEPAAEGVALFGGSQRGAAGMALTGARSVRCLVPPGRVTLRIEAGAIPTPDGFEWGSGQPVVEESLDAVAGQANAVTLRIPEPAPTPTPAPAPKAGGK